MFVEAKMFPRNESFIETNDVCKRQTFQIVQEKMQAKILGVSFLNDQKYFPHFAAICFEVSNLKTHYTGIH